MPHPRDAYLFLVLACLITWTLDLPYVLACLEGTPPPGYALPLVGLGALGPTAAAALLAWRRGRLKSIFVPWRARWPWLLFALLLPAALHLPATAVEAALGGAPQWFHPPARPEFVVAMIMFSFGEEFGWRGFGYRALAEQHGPVVGALLLGAVWGLWHLGMLFQPNSGAPSFGMIIYVMVDLALWSVVIAWLFERTNRSMAVAIAVHAGAHLDNVSRVPQEQLRLRLLLLGSVAIAAAWAARQLLRRTKP